MGFFTRSSYSRLGGQSYNYGSFIFFCVFLAIVGVLNVISPNDGIGGNLFQVLHSKIKGTYSNVIPQPDNPFEVTLKDIRFVDQSVIHASVLMTAVGKISCTLAKFDEIPNTLVYPEMSNKRHYVRTNTTSDLSFSVVYQTSVVQRLFCKCMGLTYRPPITRYVFSDPFVMNIGSFVMLAQRDMTSVSVSLQPRYSKLDFSTTLSVYRGACEVTQNDSKRTIEMKSGSFPLNSSFNVSMGPLKWKCSAYEAKEGSNPPEWKLIGTSDNDMK